MPAGVEDATEGSLLLQFYYQPLSCTVQLNKPLHDLSSAGFRQPYNALRGMSWRAAKAIISGNIISPVPGLEEAREVFERNKNIKQTVGEKLVK